MTLPNRLLVLCRRQHHSLRNHNQCCTCIGDCTKSSVTVCIKSNFKPTLLWKYGCKLVQWIRHVFFYSCKLSPCLSNYYNIPRTSHFRSPPTSIILPSRLKLNAGRVRHTGKGRAEVKCEKSDDPGGISLFLKTKSNYTTSNVTFTSLTPRKPAEATHIALSHSPQPNAAMVRNGNRNRLFEQLWHSM